MNYTKNGKIAQVTEKPFSVGVNICSETNFARAFNWRGQELSMMVFRFSNSLEGFPEFSGVSQTLQGYGQRSIRSTQLWTGRTKEWRTPPKSDEPVRYGKFAAAGGIDFKTVTAQARHLACHAHLYTAQITEF